MTTKIVLTGGPGAGKSSILLALERRGNYIIREAAEDHIKLRQAQGQAEPWTESDFQEKILNLQRSRERKIPEKVGWRDRIYIDRGIADGLAYAEPGTKTYEKILEASKRAKTQYYQKVYLIEALGQTEKTGVRRENHDEAVELGDKLERVYKDLGYEIVRIGQGTVNERANQIDDNVGSENQIWDSEC